jgi:hypothetical protein
MEPRLHCTSEWITAAIVDGCRGPAMCRLMDFRRTQWWIHDDSLLLLSMWSGFTHCSACLSLSHGRCEWVAFHPIPQHCCVVDFWWWPIPQIQIAFIKRGTESTYSYLIARIAITGPLNPHNWGHGFAAPVYTGALFIENLKIVLFSLQNILLIFFS